MIYTSYYGNWRSLPMNKCIGVSRGVVRGIHICKELVPPSSLLRAYKNKEIDEFQYERWYKREVLDKLNVNKMAVELNGCVLLCYEAFDKFCHRHLIAKWFNDNGFECKEWENGVDSIDER